MITRSATTWLGFWALVLFGMGAGASAQAAPPTPIFSMPLRNHGARKLRRHERPDGGGILHPNRFW